MNQKPTSIDPSLREALRHLYDPVALRDNELFALLIRGKRRGPLALQELIIEAIEELEPDSNLAPQADAWRIYRILTHRFVEQFTQQEVAANLGLSIRQLRREEQRAIQTLAAHMRRRHTERLVEPPDREISSRHNETAENSQEQPVASEEHELAWVERSIPSEPTDVNRLVMDVLETTRPLLTAHDVTVDVASDDRVLEVSIQQAAVRQALLGLIAAAARATPSGRLRIALAEVSEALRITLQISGREVDCTGEAFDEAVSMARQLLGLSNGRLDLLRPETEDCSLLVQVYLPLPQAVSVLVIDDNADTLHLYKRYLDRSPYRFVGLSSPEETLSLAVRIAPKVIILDVMLPGIDGWEILGRLRESPETSHIPVVVSTILPQEAFALTLGAAAFLRKPFTQHQLLKTLDRVLHGKAAPPAR